MTDIVERLRRNAARMSDLDRAKEDLTLAADEIETLRAHRDSLMAIVARQAMELEQWSPNNIR